MFPKTNKLNLWYEELDTALTGIDYTNVLHQEKERLTTEICDYVRENLNLKYLPEKCLSVDFQPIVTRTRNSSFLSRAPKTSIGTAPISKLSVKCKTRPYLGSNFIDRAYLINNIGPHNNREKPTYLFRLTQGEQALCFNPKLSQFLDEQCQTTLDNLIGYWRDNS